MSIYFVRHGQTDWNKQGKMQGKSDIPLNETGRMQALETARNLEDIHIQKIYCSPLLRARETAEIINHMWKLPIVLDERISERSFGLYEGKPSAGLDYEKLWSYSDISPFEKGEDSISFYTRIENFLDDIIAESEEENILIVAHGGVSIAFHCYFQGYEGRGLHTLLIGNCEICRMDSTKYRKVKEG